MTGMAAIERIQRARRGAQRAVELWDATDLSKIRQCQELLQQAAADLRAVVDAAGPAPAEARVEMAALRRDANRLVRLVDACSAFQRGLILRAGGAAQEYDASGEILSLAADRVAAGVEG